MGTRNTYDFIPRIENWFLLKIQSLWIVRFRNDYSQIFECHISIINRQILKGRHFLWIQLLKSANVGINDENTKLKFVLKTNKHRRWVTGKNWQNWSRWCQQKKSSTCERNMTCKTKNHIFLGQKPLTKSSNVPKPKFSSWQMRLRLKHN